MSYVVKVRCQGTAERPHPLRTVAQFSNDDGWARVHDRVKRDLISTDEGGQLFMRHLIHCDHPGCIRAEPRWVEGPRLYQTLDYAQSQGNTEIVLR